MARLVPQPPKRGRPQRIALALGLLGSLVAAAGILRSVPLVCFVGLAPQLPRARAGRLEAFPWESAEGGADAERAYETWAAAYPTPARDGNYLGRPCPKNIVLERYGSLRQLVGADAATLMVEKEPILLCMGSDGIRRSYEYLKAQETPEEAGLALDVVSKNPRILTVEDYEFRRTDTKLTGLAPIANVVDALRPLGPFGLSAVIFGSFVVLLLVLRPLLYGVNGGPSVLSILGSVFSPITSLLATLPNPREVLESNGINPAALVLTIPLFQVFNAFWAKYAGSED